MGKTSIEWTDLSWPVVNGCRRISPGCKNCYAERLASTRLSKTDKYRGLAVFGEHGPRWTGESRLWERDLTMPLRTHADSRIFVADMGDLFFEGVPDHVIDRVVAVMVICAMRENGPAHTFQVLTKRSDRMRQYMGRSVEEMREALCGPVAQMMEDGDGWWDQVAFHMPWPLPNVWLGVSVEDQRYADERVPHLLKTPAVVRFVSYEPALGPVSWREEWLRGGLDQVIVGGESGPGARPFRVEWAASVIEQCRAAGVSAFVKQLGADVRCAVPQSHEWPTVDKPEDMGGHWRMRLKKKKGNVMEEWPPSLRVREFPQTPLSRPPTVP